MEKEVREYKKKNLMSQLHKIFPKMHVNNKKHNELVLKQFIFGINENLKVN